MQTTTLEMRDIDVEAIAGLTFIARQRSPLRRDDRTLDGLREYFENARAKWDKTVMVTARDDMTGELLGWMSVHIEYPELGIILQWQPVVHPRMDPDKVARALIEHSKTLVKTHSRSRLEVWFSVQNEEIEAMSSTYISWYETCGFFSVATEYFFDAKISELALEDTRVPDGMEIISLSDVSNEEIKKGVLDTFLAGKDQWFLSQTEAQQEATFNMWFDRGTGPNREASLLIQSPPDNDASFILKKDDEFVGFMVARVEGNEAELGPIGILPEYRGKGLGKALLSLSIDRLKSKDVETVYLGATAANDIAIGLYTGLGFKKQYHFLLYSWMP